MVDKNKTEEVTYDMEQILESMRTLWFDFPIDTETSIHYTLVSSHMESIRNVLWLARQEARR